MTRGRFEILLQKFKTHSLEPVEYEEFMEGIREGQHDELLSEDILGAIHSHDMVGKMAWGQETVLLELIKKNIGEFPVHKIPLYRRTWLRTVAAAAVLFLIGTVTYLVQKKPSNLTVVAITPINSDIEPGGNKAVLTLGNGYKIILDSAHDGILARQGNINIIKTDSGNLTYKESNEKPTEIFSNTLATPRGGQYQLTLPDGTKVWLNAASSITYPSAFVGHERKVSITGEVYLEVVHNALKPFKVEVSGSQIEDLGTQFNINAYSSNDENLTYTTLLEGSVKIIALDNIRTIKPGEQASTSSSNKQIIVRDKVDLDNVMAWKNGKMVLSKRGVRQLMSEISRWYDVDIEYHGIVPVKQFSGSIRRDVPLSSVLHALKAYGIETQLIGRKIVIY